MQLLGNTYTGKKKNCCYLKFKCNWASYNLSGSPKVIFRNEREREESVRLNVMELQVVFAFWVRKMGPSYVVAGGGPPLRAFSWHELRASWLRSVLNARGFAGVMGRKRNKAWCGAGSLKGDGAVQGSDWQLSRPRGIQPPSGGSQRLTFGNFRDCSKLLLWYSYIRAPPCNNHKNSILLILIYWVLTMCQALSHSIFRAIL